MADTFPPLAANLQFAASGGIANNKALGENEAARNQVAGANRGLLTEDGRS